MANKYQTNQLDIIAGKQNTMMAQLQNSTESERKAIKNQKMHDNDEEIKNQLTEATQHMEYENHGAMKSKLKRIKKNEGRSKAVRIKGTPNEEESKIEKHFAGIKRKHDEMDGSVKATAGREIIIMGGVSANSNALSSVTIFNSVNGTYTEKPSMNYRREEAAACVYNNDVIIAGGWDGDQGLDTIEILEFNQHPPRWTISEGFLRFRLSCHVLIVYQQKLLIIGGYVWDRREISDEINELVLTPPSVRMFPTRMPQPRNMHRAEVVNGNLFILGGRTTNNCDDGLDSVIRYDPTTNEFEECAPLPWSVSDMATVTWGNKIIVFGGEDINGQDLNDVIMYDTETGQSERLPSLGNKRRGHLAVIINDVIFVFGGWNDEECPLNSVESFRIGSDRWTELPGTTDGRLNAAAVVKP